MARVAVVGNATTDRIRWDGRVVERPGGTVVYASLALASLGHDVRAVGHAPEPARDLLRGAGVDAEHLRPADPGTRFVNVYREPGREQWAKPGPSPAIEGPEALAGADAVLLGPVLGEVPPGAVEPSGAVCLVDVQGYVRRLGEPGEDGFRPVEPTWPDALPACSHARGSVEELAPALDVRDQRALADRLSDHAGAPATVTSGAGGALAVDGRVHRARLPAVEAEDPTGAGDVFDAGLLDALVDEQGTGEALAWAAAAAERFLARGRDPLPERMPDRDVVRERARDAEVTVED